jgi:sulfatase modifying factor 1
VGIGDWFRFAAHGRNAQNTYMPPRALLPTVATILVAFTLTTGDVPAQTSMAKLSLEQSTNGLNNWQRVPLTAEMLNNGDIDLTDVSSNAFYRMKIAVSPTPPAANMITVQGGTLPASSQLVGTTVATFRIGKYEVTWDEWQEVREWAITNGYSDLVGVGAGSAGNHPVRHVSWYEVVKWSNARSEKTGLAPVYQVGGTTYRTGVSVPTVNSNANGYRLPTVLEWTWAERGGLNSQGYVYSGSNDANAVAWYFDNSSGAVVNMDGGRGTWPAGTKAANELGIHDMNGNVWEWFFDAIDSVRRIGGGSWISIPDDFRLSDVADNPGRRSSVIGFRSARNL